MHDLVQYNDGAYFLCICKYFKYKQAINISVQWKFCINDTESNFN